MNKQNTEHGILNALQWEQRIHDTHYHTDISVLRTQDRLKHLMLHLTKYVCRLAPLLINSEDQINRIRPILIDTFIITLSIANVYNVKLSSYIIPSYLTNISSGDPFRQIVCNVLDSTHDEMSGTSLILELISVIGNMAKALEAWDHVEEYNWHGSMLSSLATFFAIQLKLFHYFGINHVPNLIRERLDGIKRKNLFHSYIQTEILGNSNVE